MTVLAQDDFSDADGAFLPAHVAPVGPAWSARKGTFKIQDGHAIAENAVDDDGISIAISAQDYVLACSCSCAYTDSSNVALADLEFGILDANNSWIAQNFAPSNMLFLYQRVGGQYYLRASGRTLPNASGSFHELKIVMQDGVASIYFDDDFVLSQGSTDFRAGLGVGLRVSKTGDFAGIPKWDDFSVVDSESAALGAFMRYRFTG